MEIKASAQAEWDLLQTDLISPGRLHVRLLGDFELLQNGIPLPRTRTRTERWLLALLVLRANQEVNRTWLAGTFWPDTSPEQALNNLRRSLSNLRQVLGEEAYRLLSPTTATITFDLAGAFCDVAAFDAAIAQGEAPEEAESAHAALRQAAALYRGPLLPDCEADWLLGERESREQACLKALETLARQARQNRDEQEAVEWLRHALRLDPFRETTQCALMEALAAQGDRAAMTLAYRQFRLLLHEELQSEPAAETKALYLRLREENGQTKPQASIPLTANTFQLHIPRPISALVGRKEESEEVAALLSTNRLVTLTGTGGVGKTRLALEVAAKVAHNFRDGVWFVDLAPVTEETVVVNVIAATLQVREESGQTRLESLRGFLAGKELLLVLDNCEHLLTICARLVTTLLQAAPGLRLLATSRQALGVSGERAWRVPSLFVPDLSGSPGTQAPEALLMWPATRLFVERAQEASASFTLTAHNAPFVADICRRLDGIALAIELAAARVNVLSAEQIAVRLEDAFRLLSRGDRAALPRQQTLRGLLDWSYALLTPLEQRLLRVLSVFAGGWTLEAATAIWGNESLPENLSSEDILDTLSELVDKSLVLVEEVSDGQRRYRLLETIRQYGQEKLQATGDTAEMHRRHGDYFLALAQEANKNLEGAQQVDWLNRLEADHNNLRLTLTHLADEVAGLQLAASLTTFWQLRGYLQEGGDWLSRMLANNKSGIKTTLHAKALHGAGNLAFFRGDFEIARALYLESLAIHQEYGNSARLPDLLVSLGNIAYRQGDFAEARLRYEEGLERYRGLGQTSGIASALGSLGNIEGAEGNYVAARSLQEESLALSRSLGDTRMTAYTLHNLGNLAAREGNPERGAALYEESLTMKRALGDRRGIAALLNNLGMNAAEAGDHTVADRHFTEAITLAKEVGDKLQMVYAVNGMAWQAAIREEPLRAVRLWGAAERGKEILKIAYSREEQDLYDGLIEAARQKTSAQAFAASWAEGYALSLEEAVQEALRKA